MCKRRGYSYELKEIIELLFHKMTDDPMNNRDLKKVGPVLGQRAGSRDAPLRWWPWGRVGCQGQGFL